MKLQGRGIDAFLRAPDPKVRAVLVYGPDAGLVRERAERLGRLVVPDLGDPFRVSDLAARTIADEPGRLADELAAQSLIGGRRLVRIRDGDDSVATAFDRVLKAKDGVPGDALAVVEAGELGLRSRLRQLFEQVGVAAALPCYVEDEGRLGPILAERLSAAGFSIDRDALALLAANLVGDRMLAQRELEKLILYMGEARRITLDDASACIGDSASLDLGVPALAAASGDAAALDRAIGRLYAEGTNPIAILRAAQRHFQRLHLAAADVASGASPEAAMEGLRPPVFFRDKAVFAGQLRRWSLADLAAALARLTEAEAACKRTGAPDDVLCARALLTLAREPGRLRR